MKYNPDIHHRRSIRMKGFDYSEAGAYFVTICTQNRECLFGDVVDGKMQLNDAGHMVKRWWNELDQKFPNVVMDEFIVMPNHVHGIIVITDNKATVPVGAIHELPLQNNWKQRRIITLPKIIGYFKMNTAKRINQLNQRSGQPVWQRNYYERVIRSEDKLNRIRQYISDNPLN